VSAINTFLRENELSIAGNPCVSPDFCLDWTALSTRLRAGAPVTRYPRSRVEIAAGWLELVSDATGDHAWILESAHPTEARLEAGVALEEQRTAFPATWRNLLRLKNLLQEHDPACTVFPSAAGTLDRSSLGVGARFTTLHWPAVEWAMAELGLSLTANQNSIPRELVFDVDAMLAGRLDVVPFPFIGGSIPEGHQGQSVEGMSHGAVLSKLKTGFHARRLPWGFNADHQPIGGKFDAREDRLVEGSLLASYITFDLSPELAVTPVLSADEARRYLEGQLDLGAGRLDRIRARLQEVGVAVDDAGLQTLLARVWPAVRKMKLRDEKYSAARSAAFSTPIGRAYFRELSIDELPGLTTPETLAIMLALCEALDLKIHFVAPAFGFQKNFPFDDNAELERRVGVAWKICDRFGASIGFHSGSGKSAENYRICGRVTGQRLEIKTSGRYTYEMGVALAGSSNATDRALWEDWYAFTRELATASAFGTDDGERQMARQFIAHALGHEKQSTDGVFETPAACRKALAALRPHPDHMFWFEYNFLYVLARDGKHDKQSLGDHSPAGYRQRARFYAISDEGQLRYAQGVARYLCFLADTTGLARPEVCARVLSKLEAYTRYSDLLADIALR
jgi:tagaturonate epimerase